MTAAHRQQQRETLASPQLHEHLMTQSPRRQRQQRLAGIRARYEAAAEISFVYSGGPTLEFTDPATGQREIMATFAADVPPDQVEQLARYRDDLGDMLNLFAEACAEIRRLKGNATDRSPPDFSAAPAQARRDSAGAAVSEKPKDYAAQAAMMCDRPAYRRFLEEHHGLAEGADPDAVREAQRKAVKIRSKADLNAAGRWLKHLTEFELWQRDL
ncbi:hypothetical protein [Hoeflea sp. TYP-13]|uniref:hypothetical protein n=1 Tax=Hoeflea sp. TYP-13 TaxID=3230023 RepID=UPI0034C67ED9